MNLPRITGTLGFASETLKKTLSKTPKNTKELVTAKLIDILT